MYRTLLPSTLVEKKNKMISMLFHLTTGRLVFITYDHNYTMWRDMRPFREKPIVRSHQGGRLPSVGTPGFPLSASRLKLM